MELRGHRRLSPPLSFMIGRTTGFPHTRPVDPLTQNDGMGTVEYLRRRYRVADPRTMQVVMQRWFETPAGQTTLAAERAACRTLPSAPGFRLVHLGMAPDHGLVECFPQQCRSSLAVAAAPGADAVVSFTDLPLPTDTLDVMVLHHVLDFAQSPHQVLAEAARTLRPGGRLILVGFDPWSPFGMAHWLVSPLRKASVWRHNSLRRSRLVDWLALLGLAVEPRCAVIRRWPMLWNHRGVMFFVIVATKRTLPLQRRSARSRVRGVTPLGTAPARRSRAAARLGERQLVER